MALMCVCQYWLLFAASHLSLEKEAHRVAFCLPLKLEFLLLPSFVLSAKLNAFTIGLLIRGNYLQAENLTREALCGRAVGCCPERESWWIHFECSWGLDCSSSTDLTTDPLVPMILKVGEISPSFGCHFKTTWLHLQVSICGQFCDSPGFCLIHTNTIQILWLLAVYPQ